MADKLPVAVLGATGAVGQRFVQLLDNHPMFEVVALAASDRSAGKRYLDACRWVIPGDPPSSMRNMIVSSLKPNIPGRLVFSALPSDVAKQVESQFAASGYAVCSNASAFRYEPDVPIIIPEVNADHSSLISTQREKRNWSGFIVTNPNCSTTGITMVLKPLHDAYRLKTVLAFTMQAVSGAGYPGVPSLDILDNVIPYINGEEEKIAHETCLLLGDVDAKEQRGANISVSAHANRAPVMDGHTVALSLGFENSPRPEEAIEVLRSFRSPRDVVDLPSAPEHPLLVRDEDDRPQPRRDRDAECGMAVTVGRVRQCPVLDLRLVLVVHNTIRGAAGGSLLNAELLVKRGLVK
jgi:aspartate-semialdehyde dehydrogenase